jgi:serine beta-lactamase-like protein LACTB
MVFRRFLILALFFSSNVLCADLTNKASNIAEILADIKKEQGYPGISLAISLKGDIYTDQIGYADDAKKKSINDATIFRAYSLTKGLTEILARILEENGKLNLNAPIKEFLPSLPSHMLNITSQQLLSHRGGIRHYRSNEEWLQLSQNHCTSPEDAFSPFINDPLISEIGKEENYSSFGYVILSGVIEAALEENFKSLMYKYVLRPSGTERTGFDDPKINLTQYFTKFYEPSNGQYVEAPSIDNSCKFGGGAINSTPADIAKVFNAYFSGKLTKGGSLQATSTLQNRMASSGEGLGGRSTIVAYPKDNLIVVIFANARGGNLQPYAVEIAELILSNG